jgi:type IV pilus assembly protein PilA
MNMNNNKGVTLIELLIVIVVIGIISAFAVPAVGNFLDSARQQSVYQDAVAVRNAAAWYCAQPENPTCVADPTTGTELTYAQLAGNLEGFDASAYDTTAYIAKYVGTNEWDVNLEADGANSGDYEWNASQGDPLNSDAGDANPDNND